LSKKVEKVKKTLVSAIVVGFAILVSSTLINAQQVKGKFSQGGIVEKLTKNNYREITPQIIELSKLLLVEQKHIKL